VTITETRMGWGAFSLKLRDDTPSSILDRIRLAEEPAAFGLLRIFSSRTDAQTITAGDAGMFTGVYLQRPSLTEMSGYSATMLLGESSDGRKESAETGPMAFGSGISGSKTITTWITDICSGTGTACRPGTITSGLAAGTAKSATFNFKTAKTILDNFICPQFGVMYRVNPDLTLDVGPATDLWPTPSLPPLAVRNGTRDLNVDGINVSTVDLDVDFRQWVSGVCAVSGIVPGYVNLASIPFGSPARLYGGTGTINWRKSMTNTTSDDTPTVTEMQTYAQLVLGSQTGRQRSVTISADEFAITQRVSVGQWLYVWDPVRGFFDQSFETFYQGKPIWPIGLRVTEVTYPIQRGMSVWFDNRHNLSPTGAGLPLDLTPYVEWEDGETTITVGAPPHTLGLRQTK
jgi:hypothetical protein